MRDDEPLRMRHPLLQVARQEARGRGADDDLGTGGRVDRPQHVALEREPLRHALLHELGPFDRRLDRGGEAEPAARRQRRADEAGEGALGVRDHLADDALRLGAGIVHGDVDAREQQARDPARADHPAADAGGLSAAALTSAAPA